jgi:hypothetical protein
MIEVLSKLQPISNALEGAIKETGLEEEQHQ